VLVAAVGDALAEFADAAADRVPRLRQPFGPEEHERDHQNEDDFGNPELKRHQPTRGSG
jgi:hypothetical protein